MSNDVDNALTWSKRAVHFDQLGNHDIAVFYYREAAKYLGQAIAKCTDSDTGGDFEQWRMKTVEYMQRAEVLEKSLKEKEAALAQSESQQVLQRCNFLFSQALDADERGLQEIAFDLYGKAAEFAISNKDKCDVETKTKVTTRAGQALDRAEILKDSLSKKESDVPQNVDSPSKSPIISEGSIDQTRKLHRGCSGHLKVTGGASYSEEEKRVLLTSSNINGIDYVPFMEVDLKERFQYAIPFSDKNGPLKLSPKQKAEFSHWARPEQLFSDPKMVMPSGVDYRAIKQTIVSDCSFVASLAVSALYEKRFSKRLITTIIYPRNKNKEPIYNPFGKYMVKLHLNGVTRKIIIDDELPVGRHSELLCSYSTRPELWVSLLEKAYMKVMGGYNFPGSNSAEGLSEVVEYDENDFLKLQGHHSEIKNIDLHALTGWIPERMAIRVNEPDFNGDGIFDMLQERLKEGHCLGTVATGELSKATEDRTGLVPTHAYAILDVVCVKGVRLVQLKNPWSHVRWRGNYSELDVEHWTSEMKALLNFDPESAAMFDNGIFWIDWESIIHFYDVFYLNWNPEIFSFTSCIHAPWRAGVGPVKDQYNISENPQYRLSIQGNNPGSVWILLTRHLTSVDDFKDNKEFIAVVVYKMPSSGSKIYYPHDPPPHIDGARINSPHYLCKVMVSPTSSREYVLVISQYEKMNNIYYTLRAYATLPFTLTKIASNYPYTKQLSDQWKGPSAGGCGNHPQTHPNNPCFQFTIDQTANVLIELKGPKQFQIGFDVLCVVASDSEDKKQTSGPYRHGFVVLELGCLSRGTYNIRPSTFYPGQEGPFILTIKCNMPVSLAKIK